MGLDIAVDGAINKLHAQRMRRRCALTIWWTFMALLGAITTTAWPIAAWPAANTHAVGWR
jgi:hypothetical protein